VTGLGLERWLLDDEPARTSARWARKLAAGHAVPTYGSAEWLQAPMDLQIAAMALAAEAHRREHLYRPQALEDELAAARHLAYLEEQAEFAAVARTVRAVATEPTHEELVERRRQPRRPVPYDGRAWHPEALTRPDAPPADRWCFGRTPDPTCPCRWCRHATSPTAQEDVA
jgi:hypothetical protein